MIVLPFPSSIPVAQGEVSSLKMDLPPLELWMHIQERLQEVLSCSM